ncbi:CRISPR system precrRNA processing endoribonuclease RAMP protein Cas6 [Pasteurella atlantica]|uniref:CRISPR system precrRNA processing endoribonuclease RAMP protein Cas6 n=1 Tax=Pasteurellaceae TaxID=712 RepID=UPI0027728169|nr:CRISPR system precrRNA processing endoribonuclease RAMP protein Cas6 [Pasteurella atlantica]MDP8098771.1 CRISPR system precrRNA processing endoribonuclease RAMP protein Cas6 [Pasteurella atlantica]MDP8106311.1 CRISPR system precrRNA processing endoribonuclease RAMP protein Cas6 [Pasteurella atlantica]MDP8116040.1 CRISPR system precrRNA processing endoribonuclease RAMP protein Cas6 [Pasteurella atlantica]
MLLNTMQLARYRFIFRVTEPIFLPDYAGSTLRGVFGRALRRISCMTKQDDCKACSLYITCPYTNIFETPPKEHQIQKFSQVPNGYIIEPPQWGRKTYQIGEELSFELVLFGKLIEQLPLIAFAFQRAFQYSVAKGKGELVDIQHQLNNQFDSIYYDKKLLDHKTVIQMIGQLSDSIQLMITTPLRLQSDGKPLNEKSITIERFLIGLAKRISLLSEFHAQPLELDFVRLQQELTAIDDHKQLKWLDWKRYSSRQNQKMALGGVVGKWTLHNVSEDWLKLLYWGQWLHCGKNATFGLGKYEMTNL